MNVGGSESILQLRSIFESQQREANSIANALEQEREALLSGDLASLEEIARRKAAGLDKLEDLRRDEQVMLQAFGLSSADLTGTGKDQPDQSDQIDRGGQVAKARQTAIDAIARCQSLNTRNGLLLQHRIGYVRRALQVLANLEGEPGVYGADGKVASPTQLRSVARG